jgi:hypothetical protein
MSPDGARASRAARTTDWTRLIVIAAVAGVASILLAFGALWAAGIIDPGGGAENALAQRAARASTTTSRTPSDVVPAACRTPLTPDDPLRLWIAGDSLAGSLGPSLGAITAATGIVQPVYDSRVSSGLSTPDFFDWPEHATSEVRRLDPEVVVFIIGANDWRAAGSEDSGDPGTPGWRTEYARDVEQMLNAFEGTTREGMRRRIYWIGSPPLEDPEKDAGARQVGDVARMVVADHPDATYIDAYGLFAGKDGKYTATLAGPDGKRVLVRADDGIHFTPDGGDLLAEHVYRPLGRRCDLDAQAIPGAAKQVIRTRGSTEVAGTNRTSASAPTTVPGAPSPTLSPSAPNAPANPPPDPPPASATTSPSTTSPSTTSSTTPADSTPTGS